MTAYESDSTRTGPIPVAKAEPSVERGSSINLVGCALSVGALGLSVSAMPLLGPVAVAFSLVALTLSALGVFTRHSYRGAGWAGVIIGIFASIAAMIVTAGLPGSPLG